MCSKQARRERGRQTGNQWQPRQPVANFFLRLYVCMRVLTCKLQCVFANFFPFPAVTWPCWQSPLLLQCNVCTESLLSWKALQMSILFCVCVCLSLFAIFFLALPLQFDEALLFSLAYMDSLRKLRKALNMLAPADTLDKPINLLQQPLWP